MLVPEEISLILSSDPANGATNRSSDGSYFEVSFNPANAIAVPKDALNVSMSVLESTIWWTIPNIQTGTNNKMYITGPNISNVSTNYTVTIPQGLYDLSQLNTAILRELENAGAKTDPEPLIYIGADNSTQKCTIRFNYLNTSVDFSQSQTIREILGFNTGVYGPYPTIPYTISAQNTASFNQVNYFLLHSDLTSTGIRYNNSYNQTIAQVLIDVAPGSQIVYKPFNPSVIDCPLAGTMKNNIKVWLTDDKNRRVNTNNEYFSCRLVIKYLRPMQMSNK